MNTRVYLLSLLSLAVDNVPCSLSETRNQRAYHHIAREMDVKHTRQIYKCMTHAKSAFHVYGLMEIVFLCYDPSNQIFKLRLFKQVIEYVSTYFITFNISTSRHLNFGILSHCTIWILSFINASKVCFISACFHFYPCSYYQGAVSIRKTVLPGMAIPMLKIRRPNGRLIFNMEIAIRR